MQPPKNFKEVQRLTGRLAALWHFMARAAEKCLSFFNTLRGAQNQKTFHWTTVCQEAFEGIKRYLSSLPLLTKVLPEEGLYLYLSASPLAIDITLVREDSK